MKNGLRRFASETNLIERAFGKHSCRKAIDKKDVYFFGFTLKLAKQKCYERRKKFCDEQFVPDQKKRVNDTKWHQ